MKAVQNRIKSAKNTKKITKAMELVSAAKMRKAVEAAEQTKVYAEVMRDMMKRVSKVDEQKIPLLETRPVENVLVVTVSSNRGLCGSFNANLLKAVKKLVNNSVELQTISEESASKLMETSAAPGISMIGIGKKSVSISKRLQITLSAVFEKVTETPTFEEILPVSKLLIDGYLQKKYDKVFVVYTHFKSTLIQEPNIVQVLPYAKMVQQETEQSIKEISAQKEERSMYIFEPDVPTILNTLIPKIIESQIHHAVLESVASEHSARMMAMKNATENAGELIEELNLEFNKARQAAITQEIAEIAGGAAALA